MYNKITLLAITAILLSACSMDPILTSSYPEDIAWKSKENAQMYANQFYPLIGSGYYYSDVENDAFSDILKANSPIADQNLIAYGSTEIVPEQNYFSNWEWGHSWAISCCRFLENLHTMGGGLPEDTRNELEAQIRWFRAKVYFEMARRFGGCVVIHRVLPDINEKEHPLCTPDQ
ncbi:MAG: RagB/SusD family nutrient uptake outer membrane protein, partial [Bacteroidales bacterium]|nr:RagB/SusD family nutrient uptake outer membrane protein [Bacteroidales bacterium]